MTPGDDTLWYFAYGSNLAPSTFLGRRGLAPLEEHVAWLDDWALVFDLPVGPGERGVANLRAQAGALTWGLVYRISSGDAAILDRSEGVGVGYYERLAVAVCRRQPAARVEAFTYRSHRGVAGRKPSARYLGIILEGARHHTLPDAWIAHLERLELAQDERLAGG